MGIDRRTFIAASTATAVLAPADASATASSRYGLIGKVTAKPGKRAELARILLDGVSGMPGCLSYIVAEDPADADTLWITEAWTDKDAHAASLSLPSVRAAIGKGRPLIASMAGIAETIPIGGHGL
ncbi:putative quinol monooxygenase [Sphingosinicella sp. BN140058]|uniref:putative quinol monooxygenase n=1 Tax=Sphingosinicella sp. BN140058 TaxID=1892855 RepID=UPI0010126EBC|nr:putative quinol monooxygenase [Sphingosinicella sp. BN140058]QAY79237.1 antibiotic biosynthesis monooxygenase [Sphingosinicella sp. BN140058]